MWPRPKENTSPSFTTRGTRSEVCHTSSLISLSVEVATLACVGSRLLVVASGVHADTRLLGAVVGARLAAIKLAISHDAGAGFHHALASGTSTFDGLGHQEIPHP